MTKEISEPNPFLSILKYIERCKNEADRPIQIALDIIQEKT